MKDSANPEAISTLALVISDVYRALPLLEAATRLNILWHVGKLCCSSQELQKRAPFLKFLLNVLEGCFTMKEPHLAGEMLYANFSVNILHCPLSKLMCHVS